MGEVRPHKHPGEPHGRLQPPEERRGGGAGPQLQQVREEGVAEDEGVAGVAGGRPGPRLARLPGLPQLARVVVGLGLVIPPAQPRGVSTSYGLWSNLLYPSLQLPVGSVLAQAPLEEVAQPGAGHEAAQEPRPDLPSRGEQRGEHEGEAEPGVAGPAHRGQGGLQLGVPGRNIL